MSALKNTLKKKYALFLKSQGVSESTVKNYLSDFNHFANWYFSFLESRSFNYLPDDLRGALSQFTPQLVKSYQARLLSDDQSIATINRRLSALRRFGEFCLAQNWLNINPAKTTTNLPLADQKPLTVSENKQLLNEFKRDLEKQKISPVSLKNYLSDLRHFFAWLEKAN